jgi:hypothetical protein
MEILTFEKDLLGLQEFAARLESFIAIEQRYVEGSLVVGLSSKFGTGKSTFLRMWKDSLQKKESPHYIVISLNAWESDYYGDPLFAIVSALVDSITEEGEKADDIVEAVKDVGWFCTAIANQMASKTTGIDPMAAGKFAKRKKNSREKDLQLIPQDAFSIYESRKNAMNSLKGAIQNFIQEEKRQVLFLVDELDRCRPDYAISYLETIKHIFDINGAVFVLAADKEHLENSAKTAFGVDLDFDEYYRRFVHREVELPKISSKGYTNIVSEYVSFYLKVESSRNCYMKLEVSRIENISELIVLTKLTPRQIQSVFRILGHVLETTEDKKDSMNWCWAVGTIMMSTLKIAHPPIYNLLGTQELPPQEALDFFKEQLNVEYADWWFSLCLTGGALKREESETNEMIFENVGLKDGNIQPKDLSQFFAGWGTHRSSLGLTKIYEKIEQLEHWK